MARGIRDEDETAAGFTVSLEAVVTRATDAALLVDLGRHLVEGLEETELWIPKSAVHARSEVFDPAEQSRGNLVVAAWWAQKKGWIDGGVAAPKKRGTWFGVKLP